MLRVRRFVRWASELRPIRWVLERSILVYQAFCGIVVLAGLVVTFTSDANYAGFMDWIGTLGYCLTVGGLAFGLGGFAIYTTRQL